MNQKQIKHSSREDSSEETDFYIIGKEFLRIMGKFFGPLVKGKQAFIAWPCIVLVMFWLYSATRAAESIKQDTQGLLLALATEMVSEYDLKSIDPNAASHLEIVEKYVDHLEGRYVNWIVSVLYSKYNPGPYLSSLLPALRKVKGIDNKEQAEAIIVDTGKKIDEFCKDAEEFSNRQIVWFESERLPDWLVTDLEAALAKCTILTDKLENDPNNIILARTTCMANRRSILLLFLAQLGYDNYNNIETFLEDITRAEKATRDLANKSSDSHTSKVLHRWADSELRRIDIITAMQNNDMDEVHKILRKAIEKAYRERLEEQSG